MRACKSVKSLLALLTAVAAVNTACIASALPSADQQEEAIRTFFEAYDAEESVSMMDDNRFVEYTGSDGPSFGGIMNYDNGGSRLRNANFQIYGEIQPEEAEKFFTEAAALFFPEEDPDASVQKYSGSAVLETSGDVSPSSFIKEAVGKADEEEHAWHAAAGDIQLSIFTRPSDTAAPRYEMIIDFPIDPE